MIYFSLENEKGSRYNFSLRNQKASRFSKVHGGLYLSSELFSSSCLVNGLHTFSTAVLSQFCTSEYTITKYSSSDRTWVT